MKDTRIPLCRWVSTKTDALFTVKCNIHRTASRHWSNAFSKYSTPACNCREIYFSLLNATPRPRSAKSETTTFTEASPPPWLPSLLPSAADGAGWEVHGWGAQLLGGKRWIYIKEIEQRRTHTYLATDSSKRSVKYPSNKVIGYLAARDARLVKKLADCSLQQLGDWPGLTKWHSWARGCDPLSTAHRLHLHQQDLYIKLPFVVLDTRSCSRLWWKDCRWMVSYLC